MGAEFEQLRIDGGADPLEIAAANRFGLSRGQAKIIQHIREHGSIRSWEAGVIMHAGRLGGCRKPMNEGTKGCCVYCSSDGSAALKLLLERGLLERTPNYNGVYTINEEKQPAD